MKNKYDAIIIGTGAGGGTIGYSLAKQGLNILFIEKGSNYNNGIKGNYAEFFKQNNISNIKWRKILKRSGRDFDNIIESNKEKFPFIGAGTGGSTAIYGMALERFIESDFEPRKRNILNEKSDLPYDGWPLKYKELIPYYIEAETLYKVRGTIDPLKNNDRFNYLSPPNITENNKELFNLFQNKGLNPYILPRSCNFLDDCIECQGFLCPIDCKNDSYNICVKPAIEKFGSTLITNAEVKELLSTGNKITGVEYVKDNKTYVERAEIYILSAGALRTPTILLKSNNYKGISNGSGLVGKNLMRHCIDLFLVKTKNKPPRNGFIKEIALNDFYNDSNNKLGTLQSFGRLPSSKVLLTNLFDSKLGNNLKIKKLLSNITHPSQNILNTFFSYFTPMNNILEDLPYNTNYIGLSNDKVTPVINYKLNEFERHQIKRFRTKSSKIFDPLKFILIKQAEDNKRIAHACGTCRMGSEKESSVVNYKCQSHEINNLYIADASIFPTSGGTNPALTIIANSLRIADHIHQ